MVHVVLHATYTCIMLTIFGILSVLSCSSMVYRSEIYEILAVHCMSHQAAWPVNISPEPTLPMCCIHVMTQHSLMYGALDQVIFIVLG